MRDGCTTAFWLAQGKESSVICMSARSIVTSVLCISLSVMISGCLFTCWLISCCADLCWLLWTQLYGSVVRAVDCRSAGPWFDSSWKSWFKFMTWSSNQIIQMINMMSPIRISIRTITRNSVKMVAEPFLHRHQRSLPLMRRQQLPPLEPFRDHHPMEHTLHWSSTPERSPCDHTTRD